MLLFTLGEVMEKDIPIEFLWEPYIPIGCVTLLAAKGGTGKSGLMLWLAAKLFREQGVHTLYVDAEHTLRHIRERSIDWGLIDAEEAIHIPVELDEVGRPESVTPTIAEMTAYAKDNNCRLIVLDSLTTFSRRFDLTQRKDAAAVFGEIRRLAVQCNAAVVVLGHLNKNTESANDLTIEQISGSAALVDLSRSVLLMLQDDNATNDKTLLHLKSNYRQSGPNIHVSFTETGLTDFILEPTPYQLPVIVSGTKAETFRQLAEISAKAGKSKKDIRSEVKASGGSEIDATRTVKWLAEQGYRFE